MADIPIVLLACKVFQGLLDSYYKDIFLSVKYFDYGLHETPRHLNKVLQKEIDDLTDPSLVVLGYGLCGNGLNGIRSGRNTLLIPRVDDCIALMLGSYQAYRREFDSNPGTYYLSKGWLESGSNPLQEYEKYIVKYGKEKAQWLMDQQYHRYRRLVFVVHQTSDLKKYRPKALEVARFCQRWGMCYQEIIGSDQYVHRLVETSLQLEKADQDFIVIPPGGELLQAHFFRFE